MAKGDKKPVVMGEDIINNLTTGGASSALSAEMGKVLNTRKINGKPFSSDVTLSATDVGAAKVHKLRATLSSPGWYRIGMFERTENAYLASGAVRLVLGGAYSYNAPTDCIVDAIVSNGINSVDLVKAAGNCSPSQISKVRVCYADEAFYLDVYFQVTTTEVVYINVHELMQGFTPHSFTNVTNSMEAVKVELDLNEWENPPMELGVEYRTTERWNGKPVYKQLINGGGLPAAGSVNIPIPSSGTIDYIISAKGSVTAQRVFPSGKVAGGMSIDLETHTGGVDVYTSHDWLGGAQFYLMVEYTLI